MSQKADIDSFRASNLSVDWAVSGPVTRLLARLAGPILCGLSAEISLKCVSILTRTASLYAVISECFKSLKLYKSYVISMGNGGACLGGSQPNTPLLLQWVVHELRRAGVNPMIMVSL